MTSPPGDKDKDLVEAIVTLADDELPNIHSMAKSLARKGFKVSTVLESSGIIAGKAQRGALDKIRAFKGVKALEESGSVDIGPPDADVQ
ncbi:MAG TPA: hypothetical protein VIT38_15685 [Allosphingosinicella sp.]|jgi:hypothetical protein